MLFANRASTRRVCAAPPPSETSAKVRGWRSATKEPSAPGAEMTRYGAKHATSSGSHTQAPCTLFSASLLSSSGFSHCDSPVSAL